MAALAHRMKMDDLVPDRLGSCPRTNNYLGSDRELLLQLQFMGIYRSL
jgi:hypothetical protein